MRIGTWNLERGSRDGRLYPLMASVLDRLGLDVAVLTEPPAALSVSARGIVASPAGRVSGDMLEAWNRRSDHAVGGLCAIDLICGPREHPVSEIVRVDPAPNGRRLSDHAGYVVDLSS